jgi:hypothetical protein
VKRADIPDEHVLDLARAWQQDPHGRPGVIQALMDEGVPRNLAYAKVEHMVTRRLLDYGVSPNYAWPRV